MNPALPKAGDVLHLTRAASVQFVRPIMFRVIRVLDWPTYHHFVWLEGYQLDARGDAVEKRSVFVQRTGLRVMRPVPGRRPPDGRASKQSHRAASSRMDD